MKASDFLIAEEINKIIKALSRDMHENVKHYREIQEEYREYIETWVHEIKTPIAYTPLKENNTSGHSQFSFMILSSLYFSTVSLL